jgi:hypothetical protein
MSAIDTQRPLFADAAAAYIIHRGFTRKMVKMEREWANFLVKHPDADEMNDDVLAFRRLAYRLEVVPDKVNYEDIEEIACKVK